MIKQSVAGILIMVALVLAADFISVALTGESLMVTKDSENNLHIKWD
jgi:hypothetical protein